MEIASHKIFGSPQASYLGIIFSVRLHGPLIKDEAFQYVARNQRVPFLVSNERGDQVLALWQEVINGRQSNIFGRILKATTHECSGCNPPNVCKKQNTCVLPFRSRNIFILLVFYVK